MPIKKPIPPSGDELFAAPKANRCRRPLPVAVGLFVVLSAISMIVPELRHQRLWPTCHLADEWGVWLPVVQILGLAAIGLRCGWPASRQDRFLLILLNGLLVGLDILFLLGRFEYARHRLYELLLRLAVAGLWCVVIFGAPFVVFWIYRRHRGFRRPFPFARWWFASLLILACVEPIAAVLQSKHPRLTFPAELADPPAGELHVVALGGSTMLGYPYEPKFGISEVVAHDLRRMYPQQEVVLHNLAQPGLNLAHAVARLRTLKVRPHLLLLYSAHNEFYWDIEELMLKSDSPFRLLDRWLHLSPSFRIVDQYLSTRSVVRPETRKKFGVASDAIASAEMSIKRLIRFRDQLRQLADFCRREQIPTLWFIPAASESGFEPNRSCISEEITQDIQRDIEQVYKQGRKLESAVAWKSASSIYETALTRYPTFAEFHFRLGDCLFHLQKYHEARDHYQQALENDGHPVRANADYRNSIALVAGEYDIPVIDSAAVLRPLSPHGILGRSLFHDNVHPTLKAFYALGNAALDTIRDQHLLDAAFGRPQTDRPQDLFTTIADLKVNRADLVSACRRIAAGLNQLALLRFDTTNREAEASHFRSLADRLEQGKIDPGDEGTEPLRPPADN